MRTIPLPMLSSDSEIREIQIEKCKTCGHVGHWHRLDDSLNIGPNDPGAVFRCLGPDFFGCDHECPNMIRETK